MSQRNAIKEAEFAGTVALLAGAPLHHAAFVGNLGEVKSLVGVKEAAAGPGGPTQLVSLLNSPAPDWSARTPLMAAAAGGHAKVTAVIFGAGADMDQRDARGRTALHLACDRNHSDVVRSLLKAGADVSVADGRGLTPLHMAAANGHLASAKLIAPYHRRVVDLRDSAGRTAAWHAASGGHLHVLRVLVSLGLADWSARDQTRASPLFAAATNGHLPVVQYLHGLGEDVNLPNVNGETALSMAAAGDHSETVRWLLAHNADPRLANNEKVTPLQIAAFNGAQATRLLAKAWPAGVNNDALPTPSPIALAARAGHIDTAKMLRNEFKANPDLASDGRTALHAAAEYGQLAATQWLIEEAGATEGVTDADGATPLMLAAARGHVPVVKYLSERPGADPLRRGRKGINAFALAAQLGRHGVVVWFLVWARKKGVDLRDPALTAMEDGSTVTCMAAACGQLACLDTLADAGFDVLAPDGNKVTPLIFAARTGHLAVVRHLVEERRAETSYATPGGLTALGAAAQGAHSSVAAYLRSCGRRALAAGAAPAPVPVPDPASVEEGSWEEL